MPSYVSYKHRKEVCAYLKAIYTAATEEEAELNLELFAEKWDALQPFHSGAVCGENMRRGTH